MKNKKDTVTCVVHDIEHKESEACSQCASGLFGYEIHINRNCTSEYYSGEQYGDWSEEYDNSFDGVTRQDRHPSVTAPFDIKSGETGYAVWAEYSTGDSFGHSTRGSIEQLAIFKDEVAAREFIAKIEDPKNEYRDPKYSSLKGSKFETSDGQKFLFTYLPWDGYFESLDSINLDSFRIGDVHERRYRY